MCRLPILAIYSIANPKHEEILYHQITSFVPISYGFKNKFLDITRSPVIISGTFYTVIPQLKQVKVI